MGKLVKLKPRKFYMACGACECTSWTIECDSENCIENIVCEECGRQVEMEVLMPQDFKFSVEMMVPAALVDGPDALIDEPD